MAWCTRVELNEVSIVEIYQREGELEQLAHRMGISGRDDVIIGLVLFEHQPHGPDIVAGESPIALGCEVAHHELLLEALLDAGGSQRDLAGHERLAAARALMIEQNARAGE